MTPLLTAIKGKYLALASYLLQHGADPNDVLVDEKTSKAHNLLMDAVVDGNQELAILLVEKGANLTYVDDEGVTIITQVRKRRKSCFYVYMHVKMLYFLVVDRTDYL